MCGRFTLKSSPVEVAQALKLIETPSDFAPRYNIAPSQDVLMVANRGAMRAEFARWGLVPSWAKDAAIGNRLINARSDTIEEKPAFRNAFTQRRCLVIADGFLEWKTAGNHKTPFYFQTLDQGPFAMAGLWETWKPPGAPADYPLLQTCCLITTEANALVGQIHDRMPVILPPAHWPLWLAPHPMTADRLRALLLPFAPEEMQTTPLHRRVNDARVQGPQCLQPDPGASQGWLL